MADQPHDNSPGDAGNGASANGKDASRSAAARQLTLAERDANLSDHDQTSADSDQTLADSDQTGVDTDQQNADLDQWASDRDQAASDQDLALGGDTDAHEATRRSRLRSTELRSVTAERRLDAAAQRDVIAAARDSVALERYQAAAERDLIMAALDDGEKHRDNPRAEPGAGIVTRGASLRRRAALQRGAAAEQRALAADDREAGAQDRLRAAGERLEAKNDREALARALVLAETDELTGARTRAAGLRDLQRDVDRCHNTGTQLAIAYVDVVGLEALNDRDGHAAGDELLKHSCAVMLDRLRTDDLLIRLGGDEFLCAMPSVSPSGARERFGAIDATLAAANKSPIRTGFAELRTGDTAATVMARADLELTHGREA